jgi:hypothetical protein
MPHGRHRGPRTYLARGKSSPQQRAGTPGTHLGAPPSTAAKGSSPSELPRWHPSKRGTECTTTRASGARWSAWGGPMLPRSRQVSADTAAGKTCRRRSRVAERRGRFWDERTFSFAAERHPVWIGNSVEWIDKGLASRCLVCGLSP